MNAGAAQDCPTFEKVFIAAEAVEDELTKRIVSRLPQAEVIYLPPSAAADPLSPESSGAEALGPSERISLGKRWLMLARYPGGWLKPCPGTTKHVCCNLWVVNPGEGCPYDCSYCALQNYLQRYPTVKLFTNTDQMLQEIRSRTTAEPKRFFRVCTGELTDSLALDHLTDGSIGLVQLFATLHNAVLELKTKSAAVENLLALEAQHNGHTVVSWSINAEEITARDERSTASLPARLAAARAVAGAGYRVGFHFDPLVYYPGWKDGYSAAVRRIFSEVDPRAVAWVSIAPLRYHPHQQPIMVERFPSSPLPFGENFLARDEKLRIFQPLRFEMLRFLWRALKNVRADMPIYMCMESAAAWRSIAGGMPASCAELSEVFSRCGGPQRCGSGL